MLADFRVMYDNYIIKGEGKDAQETGGSNPGNNPGQNPDASNHGGSKNDVSEDSARD